MKVIRGKFIAAAVVGVIGTWAIWPATAQETREAASRPAIDWQKTAENAGWGWQEDEANPLSCIGQSDDKYAIRLQSAKNDRHTLVITILAGDKEVYSWRGHRHSVFRVLDDRLYYAKFHFSASGGSIVSVDLKVPGD